MTGPDDHAPTLVATGAAALDVMVHSLLSPPASTSQSASASALPLATPSARTASLVRIANLDDAVDEAALRGLLAAFGPLSSLIFRQTTAEGYVCAAAR